MLNTEIEKYYDSGVEKERLSSDVSQLEFVRTKEIISRYLNKTSLNILDIGGGTGAYSFWLKEAGHSVHLIDAVESNIKAAKENFGTLPLDSATVGDARKLPYKDEEFDIVLLMGPLYHLQEKEERLLSIREAKRVLKNGGRIFCAAISRYASVLDGFNRNLVADKDFVSIMKQDLLNGKHSNPTNKFDYFTTAFFHHPDELEEEIYESGLVCENILPVESFGWLVADFAIKWKGENFRNLLLETISSIEKDRNILAVSAHLLGIAIK